MLFFGLCSEDSTFHYHFCRTVLTFLVFGIDNIITIHEREGIMRYTLILLLLIFGGSSLLSAPTTLTQDEQDEIKKIEYHRGISFGDREIDRLHASIINTITKIKVSVDSGFYSKYNRYMEELPLDEKPVFQKDASGKTYIEVFLDQGITHNDFPDSYSTFDTRAFIYPSEDFKTLTKVIIQFKKTKESSLEHIREMRRIVNNTPNFPATTKLEGQMVNGVRKIQEENIYEEAKADANDDIVLEYYSSNDGVMYWANKPDIAEKPGMENKLHDIAKDLLPFDLQKSMIKSYKKSLQQVNKTLDRKFYIMELNKNTTTKKMLDINY